MAEALINREIALALSNGATGVPEGRVCDATLAEWNEFQKSENQVLKSSRMEWIHGTIYIAELPSFEHEKFVSNFTQFIHGEPVTRLYLQSLGSAYNDRQPRLEPDASYGPREGQGSKLPDNIVCYNEWRTLIVEVGHARTWGTSPGMLDWKAQRWAQIPGVRFVLCVTVTDRLVTAEYKLYIDPVSIVAPRTEVSFDARTLLGLQPYDPLPRDRPTPNGVEFPDPLVVDLYKVLVLSQSGF